ncbi:nucleotide-diphospho-sugar transferase [Candidatus Pseudothioglobus sp. Uisw_050_01]|uniref:nucleotide-diphospho-sugar transferase n=1 Tax=Candidatus Pseudothioglobus sp. Uisw_050_01 TaxID=3230997 RepID=UPI003A88A57E
MSKNESNIVKINKLNTATLLMTFNRLDTTKEVFESIRKAKVPRLYISSDGARPEIEGELEMVTIVRDYLISNVDWPCEVKTRFNEANLGCKKGCTSAIDWFFENEEMGVILEDDCLPSQSFFWYCEEMLEKFKDDKRVMHVAGMTYVEKPNNFQNYSYHFCNVGGVWGWATWRRAWALYEYEMESYLQAKEENLFDSLLNGQPEVKRLLLNWFEMSYSTQSTWDFQWTYTKIINSSINIMPSKNLIRNIGHGHTEATHTILMNGRYSNMELNELSFPLKHPKFIVIDRVFDQLNFKYNSHRSFINNIYYYIDTRFPRWVTRPLKYFKNLLKNN